VAFPETCRGRGGAGRLRDESRLPGAPQAAGLERARGRRSSADEVRQAQTIGESLGTTTLASFHVPSGRRKFTDEEIDRKGT